MKLRIAHEVGDLDLKKGPTPPLKMRDGPPEPNHVSDKRKARLFDPRDLYLTPINTPLQAIVYSRMIQEVI
jgi:hypothetical protein